MISRLEGMGSTDVVEVAGLAPWQDAGPWRVYNLKTGVVPEDSDVTEEMAWGHTVEGWLRDWYEANHMKHTGGVVDMIGRIPSRRYQWLWATPDGRINVWNHQHRYLEIKNVGSFMAHLWDRSDDDGIPHHVRGQVTIGMFCAEVREWTVVAAIGGLPPRIYHVQYDAELAERLVETGRKFWIDNVCARVPPAIDASDACRTYLMKKYPKDTGERRESTLREDGLAEVRAGAAERAKRDTEIVKAYDAQLLTALGDAKGIRGDGWQLTSWVDKASGQRRTRFTVRGEREE